MMVRMDAAHPDARLAARDLARARWGDTKLRAAIATLRDRRDELGRGCGRSCVRSPDRRTPITDTGINPGLPPQIQRRMMLGRPAEIKAEKELATAQAQRAEEACNTAMTVYLEAANARGEYPSPAQLAAAALPATGEERDRRLRDALQFSLDGYRAQYEQEQQWEKDHPRPPTGPPEPLHVFVDDPVIVASPIKRTIASRSRHWQAWREKVAAAEAARRAVEADRNLAWSMAW
jgi:hypothetical protein